MPPPVVDNVDPDTIARRRAAALAALPRIGVSQITNRSQMVRRLEDIALELGGTLQDRKAKGDPQWWESQDLLDDVLDLLDAAKAGVP